jgi:hypothetical protein
MAVLLLQLPPVHLDSFGFRSGRLVSLRAAEALRWERAVPLLMQIKEGERGKDQMTLSKEVSLTQRLESRWQILAQVLFLFLLLEMPARIRLGPSWLGYSIGIALIVPILGVQLLNPHPQWLRLEKFTTIVFATAAEAATLAILGKVMVEMLSHPERLTGRQLLASSIAAWVTNVVVFSIMYWRVDRGGPEARANHQDQKPEWIFPQAGIPEGESLEWEPKSVDYLFLSFCTATAFSPTDVLPNSGRAKILMMIESSVSLLTTVVVASRAINILGSSGPQ